MRYLYYIYTLLYIEKGQKQTGKGRAKRQTEQEEREPGQRPDGLQSCPPRPRSLPSSGDGRAEQNEQTKQKEREPGRRMPPQSLPVPRLSSVPSATFTVHTIASRSPLRPLVSALRERDGRPPRPLLGDVIATTSPANNRGSSPAGAVCHPAASRLRPFVPLFALISSARSCLTFCQPFCPPLPLCQVVMGRADHQPGQAIPSRSSCRPSPPLPGPRHIGGHPGGRGGGRSAYLVRRGSSVRFKVSGIFARMYRSKYQLFIFSDRLCRATPVHRGNGNCT